MLDSSANDRNPVLPIIPVIDEALGRLRYFPIGPQRGLPHSSEIGFGEPALGQERPISGARAMSASTRKRPVRCVAVTDAAGYPETFTHSPNSRPGVGRLRGSGSLDPRADVDFGHVVGIAGKAHLVTRQRGETA